MYICTYTPLVIVICCALEPVFQFSKLNLTRKYELKEIKVIFIGWDHKHKDWTKNFALMQYNLWSRSLSTSFVDSFIHRRNSWSIQFKLIIRGRCRLLHWKEALHISHYMALTMSGLERYEPLEESTEPFLWWFRGGFLFRTRSLE